MILHLDFETRSDLDLKRVGVHRYAEDPSTEILLASYRFGDGETQQWTPNRDLHGFVVFGNPIIAHNATFERTMMNAALEKAKRPERLHPAQQVCTMARAAALSLPMGLEQCGEALAAPIQKDKDGYRLMLKMCKASYKPKPGELERLSAYCDQDVASECAIDKILPPLSESEQRLWVLDQIINDRGFAIDVPLVEKALTAVTEAKRRADRKMWELTNGAVSKCTETVKIVNWLNSRGIPCESVAEGETDELFIKCGLFDDESARAVVKLRASSSRTFKFQTMLDCVCRDGRIRGTMAYHGTISGRWAGRLVQPQNLKRVETDDDERIVAFTIASLSEATGIEPDLSALSLIARACIVAPPGKKLVGGDFSNIEGRINAWLAGETWKVEAFARGDPMYETMAARILGKPVASVAKKDRQLWGKVPELACGYQGGVNAFHKMGANYGVRVESRMARTVVAEWRDQNPAIVAAWRELQEAGIEATSAVGVTVSALNGRVSYRHANGFLFCQIPSGRVIAYPGAIVERKSKIVVIYGEEIEFNNWGVSFWHGTPFRKIDLYGGMQCAHVVSGTARDILASAMHRIEAAGYPIVLTVHDEALSEVDADFGSAEHYRQIMIEREAWFDGLPLEAKCWEGDRYG